MGVVLTLFWTGFRPWGPQHLAPTTLDAVRGILPAMQGLIEALIFTPATASDSCSDDGTGPPLGLQLDFETVESLEAAAGRHGALQALFEPGTLAELDPATAEAQAFLRRLFPVDHPCPDRGATGPTCSYVVHYAGPAQDGNAWLGHYLERHPPIMRRLPGIRAIEILTPIDWVNRLPIAKVSHMQRNRVAFDSPEALTAALHSPVRDELRKDFDLFPPFDGGSRHYAMQTETFHG